MAGLSGRPPHSAASQTHQLQRISSLQRHVDCQGTGDGRREQSGKAGVAGTRPAAPCSSAVYSSAAAACRNASCVSRMRTCTQRAHVDDMRSHACACLCPPHAQVVTKTAAAIPDRQWSGRSTQQLQQFWHGHGAVNQRRLQAARRHVCRSSRRWWRTNVTSHGSDSAARVSCSDTAAASPGPR